jgi:hypothetical protein
MKRLLAWLDRLDDSPTAQAATLTLALLTALTIWFLSRVS